MTGDHPREVTREIAQAAMSRQLPESRAPWLLGRAVTGFVDTIAVALAAAAEPARQLALNWAATTYQTNDGGAAVWGGHEMLSAVGAAFVNGVAAHALDYDDVSASISGHPSAVLVPALLAIGERLQQDGRSMLEAYLVGIHVSSSVAAGFGLAEHYEKGWHATTTVGTIGAAAATARLSGLTVEQAVNAIGIAGSLAAGSRANFGSMVKPLHVGAAASTAVMAAQLAATGFEASPNVIEAPLGFLALHAADPVRAEGVLTALDSPLDTYAGTACTKKYPCCYQAHRAIDATLDLRAAIGDDVRAVRRVTVTVDPGSDCSLIHPNPADGSQARFSMPYAVAAALVDGRVDFDSFTTEAVSRRQIRDVMQKIAVRHELVPPFGGSSAGEHYAVVEIDTADGRSHHTRVDAARGDNTRPLETDEIRAKVRDCLKFGKSSVDPDRLFETVGALAGDASARRLAEVLTQ